MYLILFFIPLILWFVIAVYCDKNNITLDGSCDYDTSKVVSIIFMVCLLFIVLIANLLSFTEQKERYMNLKLLQETKMIYQNKSDEMTKQYKEVLIKNYPSFEKEIFGKMTNEDLKLLFVKYPEIKSAVTNLNYVDKIESLNKDIYDTEIECRKIVKSIRFCLINPWILNSFVPSVPEDLKPHIN